MFVADGPTHISSPGRTPDVEELHLIDCIPKFVNTLALNATQPVCPLLRTLHISGIHMSIKEVSHLVRARATRKGRNDTKQLLHCLKLEKAGRFPPEVVTDWRRNVEIILVGESEETV